MSEASQVWSDFPSSTWVEEEDPSLLSTVAPWPPEAEADAWVEKAKFLLLWTLSLQPCPPKPPPYLLVEVHNAPSDLSSKGAPEKHASRVLSLPDGHNIMDAIGPKPQPSPLP